MISLQAIIIISVVITIVIIIETLYTKYCIKKTTVCLNHEQANGQRIQWPERLPHRMHPQTLCYPHTTGEHDPFCMHLQTPGFDTFE